MRFDFKRGIANTKLWWLQNKPKALMVSSGALSVCALASAIVNAEEAARLKGKKREELAESDVAEHPIIERAKVEVAALPAYIPAVGMEAASLVCLGMSGRSYGKQMGALAASYGLAQEALSKYKAAVVEKIGENKALALDEEIHQKNMHANPPQRYEDIIVTGEGEQLYYDEYSGRWFFSTDYRIHRYENLINQKVNQEGYAILNDWYDMNGLEDIPIGNMVGWDTQSDIRGGSLMSISLTPTELCIGENPPISAFAISYQVTPIVYPDSWNGVF